MHTATPPAATLADLAAAFLSWHIWRVLAGAAPYELATGIRAQRQARQ
jgi:hypothetical protein